MSLYDRTIPTGNEADLSRVSKKCLECISCRYGINFIDEQVPDATTLLKFRHLLEKNHIGEQMFSAVNYVLEQGGAIMKGGTIVDATIINAPSSTKNKEKARDPEMHQTKKGNEWRFGMKCHIGVDAGSGYVHTIKNRFGFYKVLYRGIAKNFHKFNVMFASTNLLMYAEAKKHSVQALG